MEPTANVHKALSVSRDSEPFYARCRLCFDGQVGATGYCGHCGTDNATLPPIAIEPVLETAPPKAQLTEVLVLLAIVAIVLAFLVLPGCAAPACAAPTRPPCAPAARCPCDPDRCDCERNDRAQCLARPETWRR